MVGVYDECSETNLTGIQDSVDAQEISLDIEAGARLWKDLKTSSQSLDFIL